MSNPHKKEAIEFINSRISGCQEAIKALRKSLRMLDRDIYYYEVFLSTLWSDEGEVSVCHKAKPGDSIEKACQDADELFMKRNNRRDVQAKRLISLRIGKGAETVIVPIENPFSGEGESDVSNR